MYRPVMGAKEALRQTLQGPLFFATSPKVNMRKEQERMMYNEVYY